MAGLLIQADLQYPQIVANKDDIMHPQQLTCWEPATVTRKNVDLVASPSSTQKHPVGEALKHTGTIQIREDVVIFQGEFYTKNELLLAQLVEAEAGNQGLRGKQLIADVVLNRVDSSIFPNSIRGVIFQKNQFSVIFDGQFARMANRISNESFRAVRKEMKGPRIDSKILYFNSGDRCMNGSGAWKYKDHWFAY